MQSHRHGKLEPIETSLSDNMFTVLFGKTAHYAADVMDGLPEPRRANIVRIINRAFHRLGPRIADDASVPSRIVGMLLADGSYCDDPVACEYWGGLIASARTPYPADDRAVRQLRLVSRLTLHQIRTHYIFYTTLRRLVLTRRPPGSIDFDSQRYRLAVFVPAADYLKAMAFGEGERLIMAALADDALNGLGMESLLDGSNTGQEDYLRRFFPSDAVQGEGIVFAPSLYGIRVFLRVFCAEDRTGTIGRFAEPGWECGFDGMPAAMESAAFIYEDGPALHII